NVVFFDVQEAQHAGIDSIIRTEHHELIDATPIVPMRIASINGKPVTDLLADIEKERAAERAARAANGGRETRDDNQPRRSSWPLRREFRSTYRDSLTESETLVSGKWFSTTRMDSIGQVSLDTGVIGDMGVKLGDTITWNVQGVQVPTVVTSTRAVKW